MATNNNENKTKVYVITIVILLIFSLILGINLLYYKRGSLGKLSHKELKELASIDKNELSYLIEVYSTTEETSEDLPLIEEPFNDKISEDIFEEVSVALSAYQNAVNNAVSNPTTENYEKLLKFLDLSYVQDKELSASNLSTVFTKKMDYTITKIISYSFDNLYIFKCDGIYVNPDDTNDVQDGYQIAFIVQSEYYSVLPDDALKNGTYNMELNEKPNYTATEASKGDNILRDYFDDEIEDVDGNLVITKNYMKIFKLYSFINPEKAYNLLEGNYREKEYGSLENFRNYVSTNSNAVYGLDIASCEDEEIQKIEENESEKESEEEIEIALDNSNYEEDYLFERTFICKDNNGKELKIHQNKMLDFTIEYLN